MRLILTILHAIAICAAGGCNGTGEFPLLGPSTAQASGDAPLFTDDFESGTLDAWQDGVNAARHRVVNDRATAQSGSRYLAVTFPQGQDGGWLTRFFMPGGDTAYVSYYVRFPNGWRGSPKLLGLYGSRIDDRWSGFGKAGRCPDGRDFFVAMVVTERMETVNPGPVRFYTYHPAMRREPDGRTCWGNFGDGSETYTPPLMLKPDTWHRIELFVHLNTPGQTDGRQMLWIDGVERGSWSGLRFRETVALRLNAVQLSFNISEGSPATQELHVDNLSVFTQRP